PDDRRALPSDRYRRRQNAASANGTARPGWDRLFAWSPIRDRQWHQGGQDRSGRAATRHRGPPPASDARASAPLRRSEEKGPPSSHRHSPSDAPGRRQYFSSGRPTEPFGSSGSKSGEKYPAAFLAAISTWASAGIMWSGIGTRSPISMPCPVSALYFMSLIEMKRSMRFNPSQ